MIITKKIPVGANVTWEASAESYFPQHGSFVMPNAIKELNIEGIEREYLVTEGYIWTDIYMKDGIKLHPRQTKHYFTNDENDNRLTCRPTLEMMKSVGISHYKGKQFKYLTFLCSKNMAKKLKRECVETLS